MQARAAATAAVERAAEPANTQAAPDLEDPSLYFNRELSWLDFNDRVLQLAEDTSVPLLERVKFCAIWESNLDEFFMVRVANLHDQLEAGVDARGADGMSAGDADRRDPRAGARPARAARRAASSASFARPSRSTGSGSSRSSGRTRRSARSSTGCSRARSSPR